MADYPLQQRITSQDLVACAEETVHVATLRYFDRAGAFADAVRAALGTTLPEVLEAREAAAAQLILAWRSPSETLCVARSSARLAELTARLAPATDGCIVDLSGGVKIIRLAGLRIADLLRRLGGTASVPCAGEARRSRLADVPVLALSVCAGETLLLVDRGHLPHLLGWIRDTLFELDAP